MRKKFATAALALFVLAIAACNDPLEVDTPTDKYTDEDGWMALQSTQLEVDNCFNGTEKYEYAVSLESSDIRIEGEEISLRLKSIFEISSTPREREPFLKKATLDFERLEARIGDTTKLLFHEPDNGAVVMLTMGGVDFRDGEETIYPNPDPELQQLLPDTHVRVALVEHDEVRRSVTLSLKFHAKGFSLWLGRGYGFCGAIEFVY